MVSREVEFTTLRVEASIRKGAKKASLHRVRPLKLIVKCVMGNHGDLISSCLRS